MSVPPLCLTLSDVRYAVGSAASKNGVTEILSGVSLTARRGEVTAIIGPNGAGKTTTLACAQGLLRPSSGSVSLLGENPYTAGADLRARIGVMLQDGGLPQSVTPRRLLTHVSRLHADPWPLEDLVKRLDMADFMSTNIRRLSGGQKQRTALAAALLGQPEVLFLDEPSAGLDPQSRQMVFQLIEHLRSLDMGIVLTTHLLEEAQRLADSVIILTSGTVVRRGSVSELTSETAADDSSSNLPRRLVFVSPRFLHAQEVASAPGTLVLHDEGTNRAGSRWAVEISSTADLTKLANWWSRWDLMPAEISFEARTLEDVFWEVSAS